MENDDIIDLLFEKKGDEDLFVLEDKELNKLNNKVEMSNKEMLKFIDARVHPKSRDKLKELITEYSNANYDYLHRENQLFYRNGISDGIELILISLSQKKQKFS